jgi:hypothetical protein
MSGILNAFVGGSYGFKPINTVAPVVSGGTTFGSTLSTTNGTWFVAPPITSYTYQWYRSPSTAIGGATSSSYTLVQADVGSTIYCQVTAVNPIGSTAANSNTTATVTAIAPSAPTIGTATSTGTTTASVTYTASASNGGSNITSYTAVSSPGGFTGSLATSGSGTINISGLSPGTSYSFVVYATNGIGNSGYSGSSNTITTSRISVSVVISSTTVDYVANTAKASGYVAGVTDVTFTVNALVGSSSTGSYAFTVDTSWAAGDTVTVVNNSYIEGASGTGGAGASPYTSTNGYPGSSGGPAVYVGRTVTFYNNAYVGGGGGGGGGGAYDTAPSGKFTYDLAGGGGGGGQGYYSGGGGAGGYLPSYLPPTTPGSPGGGGSYTGAGAGGAGGYLSPYSGRAGGSGGGLGSAGAAGANGVRVVTYGGAGGAGGACLVGKGYVNGGGGIGGAAYGGQT